MSEQDLSIVLLKVFLTNVLVNYLDLRHELRQKLRGVLGVVGQSSQLLVVLGISPIPAIFATWELDIFTLNIIGIVQFQCTLRGFLVNERLVLAKLVIKNQLVLFQLLPAPPLGRVTTGHSSFFGNLVMIVELLWLLDACSAKLLEGTDDVLHRTIVAVEVASNLSLVHVQHLYRIDNF